MSVDHEQCTGAAYHSPVPLWSERHHVYPSYLAALLGLEPIPFLRPLCGNCHTRVHHALRHLINTGQQGHRLSDGEQVLTDLAWSWWQVELIT